MVELPAVSNARAVSVWAPFATVRVSHARAYGAVASWTPTSVPSTRNCTPATPTLSLALAMTFTMSDTCALLAGDVIATVGGVMSPGGDPPTGVFMSAWICAWVSALE